VCYDADRAAIVHSVGFTISRAKLPELATSGRVVAQSAEAHKRRSETQRFHEAAKLAWHSSAKPACLNEDKITSKRFNLDSQRLQSPLWHRPLVSLNLMPPTSARADAYRTYGTGRP